MSADCNELRKFVKRGFYRADDLDELLGKVFHDLDTSELKNVEGDSVQLGRYVGVNVTLMYG